MSCHRFVVAWRHWYHLLQIHFKHCLRFLEPCWSWIASWILPSGSTPIYTCRCKLHVYGYVPLWRVVVFKQFILGWGIEIRAFWSRIGYHFFLTIFNLNICSKSIRCSSRELTWKLINQWYIYEKFSLEQELTLEIER